MSIIIDFFNELIDKVVDITSMQCLWVLAVATGIIFLICYIRVLIKMFSLTNWSVAIGVGASLYILTLLSF